MLTFCYMDWRPQLAMLGFEVQKDGWGPELELRNVTGKGVQSSPILTKSTPLTRSPALPRLAPLPSTVRTASLAELHLPTRVVTELGGCAALRLLVGEEVVAEPIVGEGSIGTISERWSQTFASIQHAHAMLVSTLCKSAPYDFAGCLRKSDPYLRRACCYR